MRLEMIEIIASVLTLRYIYFPICMVGIGEIGMIVASQILVATAANNKETAKYEFFSLRWIPLLFIA